MKNSITISGILIDDDIHPRATIDSALVSEYAEAMSAGAVFPPIVVFQDGKKYFLGDGRHRVEAARKLGRKEITAQIRKGTKRDAILYAVGANNEHGIRRSNADKRKAVLILLKDKEWRGWAHNKIAKTCNVSWDLVEDIFAEHPDLQLPEDSSERTVERKGKVYSQNTENIGRKKAKTSSPAGAISQMITLTANARDYFVTENKPKLVAKVDNISAELQGLLGDATGAKYRLEDGLGLPINVYERPRGEDDGVKPNPEFAKKGLCNYSVGVGLMCGHQCTYCSTPSLLRTHGAFGDIQITAFNRGFAIIDPNSPERIRNNIPKNLTPEDVIQLSTIDDAWSPEARKYDLGRKVMEVLLEETPAQIRVLTKCADVAKDFKLFKEYGKRVIVGLSTGIPPQSEDVAKVIEPNASPIRKRLDALMKAHDMGLRTYGMLCPCLPLVADRPLALHVLFDEVLACGAEDIWLEPVNPRGKALINTAEALQRAGLTEEAKAIDAIRTREKWSAYTRSLIERAIDVATEKKVLDKLHILLYPSHLMAEHLTALKKHRKGIVWLEKTKE